MLGQRKNHTRGIKRLSGSRRWVKILVICIFFNLILTKSRTFFVSVASILLFLSCLKVFIFQFPRKFVKFRFGLKIKISHLIHSTNKPSWSNFHFPRWITRFENQTTSSYCLFYDFQDCVDRSNVLHNCRVHCIRWPRHLLGAQTIWHVMGPTRSNSILSRLHPE